MPTKDKCGQCPSFTAALCIQSCHFLLCPSSFVPPRLLPLQTLRQKACYFHHRHTKLELIRALMDFSNLLKGHLCSMLMHYMPANFTSFVAVSCRVFETNLLSKKKKSVQNIFENIPIVSTQHFHAFFLFVSQVVHDCSNNSPISKYNIQNFSPSPGQPLFTR